jgi:N utilization substance protein A
MNYEVVEALGQIAREKNVDKRLVIETLEAGLQSAAKKKYGATANFVVEVDEKQGKLGVFQIKKVVDEVLDPAAEIDIREAHETHPDASVGDDVRFERPFAEFGRNAIMAAKQVVVQRVREAEREQVYADFQGRVGDIITGTVQQVDRGNYFVNLGRTEALLPIREQISRERYRQGETLRAVLLDVQKNTKGPQVILSRTHPMFLQKLFEIEVPEIKEKIVEIKAIAREPGLRSKIAVVSHEEKVDPVGACVGMKGSRVQAVVRELNGERIDIVPWASDAKVFVARALAPAKIQTIELNEGEKAMTVIVADDQLSLAIGKKGQNARLAAKLVGWKIDLVCESERKKVTEQQEMLVSIEELPGVGEKLAKNLLSEGIETIQDLSKMSIEQLTAVPGIGEKTAEKLFETAKQFLAALRTELDRKRFETEEDTEEIDAAGEEEMVAVSPDDEVVTDEMVAEAARRRTETLDEDAEASPAAELIDELEDVVPRELPETRVEAPINEDGEILSAEERARQGAGEPEEGKHAE